MAESDVNVVKEPERSIPVYQKVDIVVVGSGSGGFAAAVSAARNGADVLLIERNSFLGGQGTASFQVFFGGPTCILTGISKEFAERLDDSGAIRLLERYRKQTPETGIQPIVYHISFDPESWKFVESDMLEESGVKVLTNTWAVDAIVENGVIKGIVIENKSGRQAIIAGVVIDATGDADIVARAGAPFETYPKGGDLQPMVMLCRIGGINYQKIAEYAREHPDDFPPDNTPGLEPGASTPVPPGGFDGKNMQSIQSISGWYSLIKKAKETGELPSRFGRSFSLVGVNPSAIEHGIGYIHGLNVPKRVTWDADDVCQAELEGRKFVRTFVKFLKTIPGFESSFLIDTAPSIGTRDSRRIVGEYVQTRKDIYEGRTFDDDIAIITLTWPDVPVTEDTGFMVHPASGDDKTRPDSPERKALFQVVFGIPYRCLIPKNIDRLLVAGHTISRTYMAHEPGTCRGMPACMAFGQAAGTAAAIAIKHGISPRQVDVQILRKSLESQGVNLRKDAIDLSEVRRMREQSGSKITHIA